MLWWLVRFLIRLVVFLVVFNLSVSLFFAWGGRPGWLGPTFAIYLVAIILGYIAGFLVTWLVFRPFQRRPRRD